MVEAGRGKRDAANGCPVGRHRNATGRGGESGRARTRPNGANATAGGCGAFGANLSADCRRHGCGDCPNPSADYPNRITANGCPELGTVAARQTIRTRHPSEPVTVGGTEEAGRGEPLPVPVRTRDRSRTCHRRRYGGSGTRRTRRRLRLSPRRLDCCRTRHRRQVAEPVGGTDGEPVGTVATAHRNATGTAQGAAVNRDGREPVRTAGTPRRAVAARLARTRRQTARTESRRTRRRLPRRLDRCRTCHRRRHGGSGTRETGRGERLPRRTAQERHRARRRIGTGANPSERRERHGGRLRRVWREPVATVAADCRRHGGANRPNLSADCPNPSA